MVDVIADDRKQVPESPLNLLDSFRELRQPRGKVGEPLRFELLVVHDDATAITERIAQRRDERPPRVASVGRQEFEMLGRCARLPLHMYAPLEGNLIVGTHPYKAWQGRSHGFKICEVDRVLQLT